MARYISGDELADARNALGMGVSFQKIAGHLGVNESELRALLGLQNAATARPACKTDDCDLFAGTDWLDSVL